MCGIMFPAYNPDFPRIVRVWCSLGFTEPVDDIQQRLRDVWGVPMPLPDDRKMELRGPL